MSLEVVSKNGARVKLHEHGAHITSWKTSDGVERLFLSPDAVFQPGVAIRGGVPVCWPQFSDFGPLKAHGVARTADWEVVEVCEGKGVLQLKVRDEGDRGKGVEAQSSFNCDLQLIVGVGDDKLDVTLLVENVGHKPAEFTCALHTYFEVSDISNVRLFGLDGRPYMDNLNGRQVMDATQTNVVCGEVDRIYMEAEEKKTSEPVIVEDHSRRSRLVVTDTNMPDVVLWNPWDEKARKMADLPNDAYTKFLCVEQAAIVNAVKLKAGEKWRGAQHIRVEAME